MTKKEIAEIIESKGAEYGFKMQAITMGWMSEQTNESSIRIEINQETDEEKTNWEERRVWVNIKAHGCICKMGEQNNPAELLKAAEEIARGAKFVEEIQQMNLSYIETF